MAILTGVLPLTLSFSEAFVESLKKLLPGQVDLSESIREAIDYSPRFNVHLGPLTIPISDAVIGMWIVMPVLALLAWCFGRRLTATGSRRQAMGEPLVSALLKLAKDSGLSQEQAQQVLPFVGSLGLFIACCNVASAFHLKPPAQNIAFPVALAILTIIVVIAFGLRFVGLKGFWYSLSRPVKALVPFKILDYFIKPLSLSFRLFGNIFGSFVLMEFIGLVIPMVLPGLLGLWFDIGDGLIQGAIFCYLSIIYIGEIVEGAHEEVEPKKKRRKLVKTENAVENQKQQALMTEPNQRMTSTIDH